MPIEYIAGELVRTLELSTFDEQQLRLGAATLPLSLLQELVKVDDEATSLEKIDNYFEKLGSNESVNYIRQFHDILHKLLVKPSPKVFEVLKEIIVFRREKNEDAQIINTVTNSLTQGTLNKKIKTSIPWIFATPEEKTGFSSYNHSPVLLESSTDQIFDMLKSKKIQNKDIDLGISRDDYYINIQLDWLESLISDLGSDYESQVQKMQDEFHNLKDECQDMQKLIDQIFPVFAVNSNVLEAYLQKQVPPNQPFKVTVQKNLENWKAVQIENTQTGMNIEIKLINGNKFYIKTEDTEKTNGAMQLVQKDLLTFEKSNPQRIDIINPYHINSVADIFSV